MLFGIPKRGTSSQWRQAPPHRNRWRKRAEGATGLLLRLAGSNCGSTRDRFRPRPQSRIRRLSSRSSPNMVARVCSRRAAVAQARLLQPYYVHEHFGERAGIGCSAFRGARLPKSRRVENWRSAALERPDRQLGTNASDYSCGHLHGKAECPACSYG
jgi:hypothetical protein